MESALKKTDTSLFRIGTLLGETGLNPSKGFVFAVFANLIWGTTFLASKITLQFWGPSTASVLRFTIAIFAMLVFFPMFGKSLAIPKTRKSWLHVFIIGISGFGLLYPFQLKGLNEIPSSLSACIMLTSPLFVLLLAAGILKEQLSKNKLIAIAIGIIGGTILINPVHLSSQVWTSDGVSHLLKGCFFTVLASVSLAVSVLATRTASKDLDPYSITFWSMMIGLIVLLPSAFMEDNYLIPTTNPVFALLALLYLALICSVWAFLLWNKAISCASPQSLVSTMHIKTPVAVLIGVVMANEALTPAVIIGTVLISFAVGLSQKGPKQMRR